MAVNSSSSLYSRSSLRVCQGGLTRNFWTSNCHQGSTGEDTTDKTEGTGEGHPSHAEEKVAMVSRPHPCVDRALRVNYAGELAAARLCAGRISALGKSAKMKQMEERGKEHVELFKKLVAERRVRPSLTLPLWDLGGFALGSISSVFSEDVAKACNEAIEDVVNDHYNSQLRDFISQGIEDDDLLKGIVKCRDDELDAEFGGLQQGIAKGQDDELGDDELEQESSYDSLRETVKSGCQLAIWLTERI